MGPFQIMLMSFPQTRSFDSRTYINTYQHTSTHISTDQHLSTYINTHQHISQQHISTHINTNQHISTRINMYQHISTHTSTYIAARYINIYTVLTHINTYQPFLLKPPKLGNRLIKTLFCPPQRQMFRSFAQQLESSLKKSWVAKDDHVGKPAPVIYWFCNYQDVFFLHPICSPILTQFVFS